MFSNCVNASCVLTAENSVGMLGRVTAEEGVGALWAGAGLSLADSFAAVAATAVLDLVSRYRHLLSTANSAVRVAHNCIALPGFSA